MAMFNYPRLWPIYRDPMRSLEFPSGLGLLAVHPFLGAHRMAPQTGRHLRGHSARLYEHPIKDGDHLRSFSTATQVLLKFSCAVLCCHAMMLGTTSSCRSRQSHPSRFSSSPWKLEARRCPALSSHEISEPCRAMPGEGLNLQAANHIFLMDPWWGSRGTRAPGTSAVAIPQESQSAYQK